MGVIMRTVELQVPSPAAPSRLDQFVAANLHGVSRRRVKAFIDAEGVRVNGRIERRAGRKLTPGELVAVTFRPSQLADPAPLEGDAVLARGDGWWALRKPAGVPTHRSSEEGVGAVELARAVVDGAADVHAAHRLDRETSGVLLLASGAARASLSKAFEDRAVSKRYLAIVSPSPGGREAGSGVLDTDDSKGRPMRSRYEVLRRSADGSRAELAVWPEQGRTHQIRIQLSRAGWPIVGDLDYGRPVAGGAPRMALHCHTLAWEGHSVTCPVGDRWEELLNGSAAASPQPQATPQAVVKTSVKRGRRKQLVVSKATARVMGGGHPWVIPDRDTGSLKKLRAGEVVDLVDPGQRFVAMAVVDPRARICARMVSRRQLETLDVVGWIARVERSIARRQGLLDDPATTAMRLVHGEVDGLPGLWVDMWGDCIVVTRLARCCRAFTSSLYDVLAERFEGAPVYEKDHMSDLRADGGAGGETLEGRWIRAPTAEHPAAAGTWTVLEAGASFEVQPTAGLTTGFYPDQRRNRRLLDERVAGRDGLVAANLFAHTGAFSISLARAGVASVYTVDLSPMYLKWYRRNLALNGLSEVDHPSVAADSLVWLEAAPPLDIVILDPPSFSKGRRRGRGWNAQRDYVALVAAAGRTLKPGGMLLCCHNLRRSKKGWLRGQIDKGLALAERPLVECVSAGPAPDFPTLRGFPEGHTFRGLLVTVA